MSAGRSPDNLEAAKRLEGRAVESVDLSERWASLTLRLDDGSVLYVDALVTGDLEIGYVSPSEAFEIDRSVMEEQVYEETAEKLRAEGHLPALFDDRLEWIEMAPPPDRDSDAAWLTHEARVRFEVGALRVYQASNGRRLIDQRDAREVFGLGDHAELDEEQIGSAIGEALTERDRSGDEG